MLESPADIIKGIVKDFESPSVSTPGASGMGCMQKGGQGRAVLAKAGMTVLALFLMPHNFYGLAVVSHCYRHQVSRNANGFVFGLDIET